MKKEDTILYYTILYYTIKDQTTTNADTESYAHIKWELVKQTQTSRIHTVTVVQVEMRFSFTSDQGIAPYPNNQQLQPPHQSESLYTMNPLITFNI